MAAPVMQRSTSLFTTYDIIALICANIKKSDLACLLTVSHDFFCCAAPRIWKRVYNVQRLLDLIPTEHRDAKNSTQSMDLSEGKAWLARFNIYAPFVKELGLWPSYEGEPIWYSLSNAVPHRPLLPDLRKLILDMPSRNNRLPHRFGSPEDLACANGFISPSLVDIRLLSGHSPWLYPDTASQLLKNIVDIAPELKTLHIDVQIDVGSIDATFHTIIQFQNLRALKCTSMMVDCEKLQLLGSLPRLESLQVVSPHFSDRGDAPPGDWALPARSFPMLRHLSAHELPDSMIVQFWCLTSLVQSLVSVSVEFQSGPSSSEIICNICRCSVEMQELSLDLNQLDGREVPVAVIDHIRKLPLRRLRIAGSGIDDLTPLISSMANLEYLDIDYASLSICNIILIAKYMPKLRFLGSSFLCLDWSRGDVKPHSVTPSPSTLCLVAGFDFREITVRRNIAIEELLDVMAQYAPNSSKF
ncbi:hypothetical protein FRC06_004572 [Ceratobasidium sp. 370]|nr:hypothetical protein FRC06_004572 [Ceratobasidium sp. 370]